MANWKICHHLREGLAGTEAEIPSNAARNDLGIVAVVRGY